MRHNLRIATILGIAVELNPSLVVVFGLLTWQLATSALPLEAPLHPSWSYLVAGVVTALLFFGSLLAHELGHALVAEREGIGVRAVTLWLFGGVARLARDMPGPGATVRRELPSERRPAGEGCQTSSERLGFGVVEFGDGCQHPGRHARCPGANVLALEERRSHTALREPPSGRQADQPAADDQHVGAVVPLAAYNRWVGATRR